MNATVFKKTKKKLKPDNVEKGANQENRQKSKNAQVQKGSRKSFGCTSFTPTQVPTTGIRNTFI